MNTIKYSFNKVIVISAILFLIADCCLTFQQFYGARMEGDLPAIVMPNLAYSKVLTDPFGLSASLDHQLYPAPNRFVVHWEMFHYFNTVPLVMQKCGVSPITSLYLSAAIIKFLGYLLFLFIVLRYIQLFTQHDKRKWIVSLLLLVPLFQMCGYNGQSGLIDECISYFFFYGLSVAIYLSFLFPFVRYWLTMTRTATPILCSIGLSILAIFLPFAGTLLPGISLVLGLVAFIVFIKKFGLNITNLHRFLPLELLIPFVILCLVSAYSIYVGTFNLENTWATLPLSERYLRLPIGFYKILMKRPGLPILLAVCVLNTIYIGKRADTNIRNMIFETLRLLLLFSLLYLLILPLGGYRSYREFIIRYDTFIPVTVCVFFYYVTTSIIVLQIALKSHIKLFIALFVSVSLFYTLVDLNLNHKSECERLAFEQLSNATDSCVVLTCDCPVLSWEKIPNCEKSLESVTMLRRWNIIKTDLRYYQTGQ